MMKRTALFMILMCCASVGFAQRIEYSLASEDGLAHWQLARQSEVGIAVCVVKAEPNVLSRLYFCGKSELRTIPERTIVFRFVHLINVVCIFRTRLYASLYV